ncbi:Rieske (2Fe-2S) protein [Oceanibium sediminis]|uniref:Rieske (2Fe-2S) protein n=1 Tax=Oceanibium sediminis TaxID=2026339 RepID=UPI000DD456FC|nr:Rieske (2Fe-2S) protein [Oceanibium sediminis]
MSDAWKDMPGAPAPGTLVCAADDMTAPTLGVDLDGFPLLLVRVNGRLLGYVNACPHQYLPLDWRTGNVLAADGVTLRCSNHQAGFDAETGKGVDGFGAGCALDPVPLVERAGQILIGGAEA